MRRTKPIVMGAVLLGVTSLSMTGCGSSPPTTTRSGGQTITSVPTSSPSPTAQPVTSAPAGGTVVAAATLRQEAGEPAGELSGPLQAASSYPGASGSAEYEQEGRERELEVTVVLDRSLAGRELTVYLNGTSVGTMTVTANGRAYAEWDSEHGHDVPAAVPGSTVQVATR